MNIKKLAQIPILASNADNTIRNAFIDIHQRINSLIGIKAADIGALPNTTTAADIGAAGTTHAANHKTGGSDVLTAADIGAAGTTHAANHKTGGSDVLTAADIGAVDINQPLTFRNKIINGNFNINQRAVSGTVTLAAGQYGHDRWKAGASGCTYTFATVENVTTLTITAGTLLQIIEGANLQSETHVLSWQGTAQGRIDSGSYGASGITGTATGGTNLTVEFGVGTLSKVQLEKGPVATEFEQRPIGIELQLCQRYYEKSYDTDVAPGTITNSGCVNNIWATPAAWLTCQAFMMIKKRTIPTVNIYNPVTGNSGYVQDRNNTSRSGTILYPSMSGFSVQKADSTQRGFKFHWTADAEL